MADRIVTHPANDAYRNGYDAIYNKKREAYPKPICPPNGIYKEVLGLLVLQDRPQDAHIEPTRDDQAPGEQIPG